MRCFPLPPPSARTTGPPGSPSMTSTECAALLRLHVDEVDDDLGLVVIQERHVDVGAIRHRVLDLELNLHLLHLLRIVGHGALVACRLDVVPPPRAWRAPPHRSISETAPTRACCCTA